MAYDRRRRNPGIFGLLLAASATAGGEIPVSVVR